MEDYHGMWAGLGLDLERHDEFLEGLGPAYQEIYLNQELRPKGMEYFDFTTSEIHGLRIKELLELKKKGRKIVGGDILCVCARRDRHGCEGRVGWCLWRIPVLYSRRRKDSPQESVSPYQIRLWIHGGQDLSILSGR